MTSPTCSRCGAPVTPGASFCSRCGNDVSGEQGNLATVKMQSVQVPADPAAEMFEQLKQSTIGEYEIYGELGRGGMATVFLAHDIALDRKVAIKVMASALLASGQAMVERFKREARTAASLSHPHIIPIYAVRESPRLLFFVMKYIEGRSLDAIIKQRGPLAIRMAQTILGQVASALGYAHRRGIIHRDVKPANIMLDEDGWSIVTDFGIAKVADSRGLTMTGVTIGTPSYMSPEQCGAKEITGASDQYSLGIVAYEMLTGRAPFQADSLMGMMWQHFNEPPPPLLEHRPDCPPELASLVERMLAKAPTDRWPTMDELVSALGPHSLAADDPVSREMRSLARGGSGAHVRESHHTPASPIPRSRPPAPHTPAPSRPVSPDAPTIKSEAMDAMTPPPSRTAAAGPAAPTTPIPAGERAGMGAGALADMPTVRSTPISAPKAGRRPAEHPARAEAPPRRKLLPLVAAAAGVAIVAGVAWVAMSGRGGGGEIGGAGAASIASIIVGPSPVALGVGGETELRAALFDSAGTPLGGRAIQWSSSNPAAATVLPVTPFSAMVRALAADTVLIEASSEGQRASATVIVSAAMAAVARVELRPAQLSVATGDSTVIRAEPKDQSGTTLGGRTIAWASSDPAVASITNAGVVVGLREGSATLTAAVEGQRATAAVRVTPARVAEVAVEPSGLSLQRGESGTLTATPRDRRGASLSGRPVVWSSSNPRIASVSPTGVVTAVAVGNAEVRAVSEGVTTRVAVSVLQAPIASVEVTPTQLELTEGENRPLQVAARDARGGEIGDAQVAWQSSDERVARVAPNGTVSALGSGSATITASAGGRSAQVRVRVSRAAVTAVDVTPSTLALKPGEATALTASVRTARGPVTDRPVAWQSSNPAVAIVTGEGVVRAVGAGEAQITATSERVRATVRVAVTAPAPPPVAEQPTPVVVEPARPPIEEVAVTTGALVATRIAAGGRHTCGLVEGGAVCWGANVAGQVGMGPATNVVSPSRVPNLTGLSGITTGGAHSCALREDGAAVCWGANDKGQLGGPTPGQRSPVPVAVTGGRRFKVLFAGERHTCGIASDDTAWCWGDNGSGQLGSRGDGPVQVRGDHKFQTLALGGKHTCGVTTERRVLCWGDGFSGQLGRGSRETQSEPVAADLSEPVIDVAAGTEHTCALGQNGRAYCWGANRAGEIGDGSRSERQRPAEAQAQPAVRFRSLTAGSVFTCGLTAAGEAYCWGRNREGELGDGTTEDRNSPVRVRYEGAFAALAAGGAHACGVPVAGGAPVCWGGNGAGQLGDGSINRGRPTPAPVVRQR